MDVGLHLPQAGRFASAPDVLRTARAAEDMGFGSVWLFDHLMTPRTSRSHYPGSADGRYPLAPEEPYLDAVALMGALAVATTRVTFGVRVLVATLRHPVVLAKELATIDVVADGRMTLCVGAGWMAEEFDAVGIGEQRRFARMDEHVAVMRNIWRNEVTGFDGAFYSHVEAGFAPRPPRGDIPVLVGGVTDGALQRAARYGDGWAAMVPNTEEGTGHLAIPADLLAPRIALLRELWEAEGRAGAPLVIAHASTRDPVEAFTAYAGLGVTTVDLVVWGDADRIISEAERFRARVGPEIGLG
ncbi:MAG TPA: TIGR03619 family F420-dependent LLM class oxidoreductase [Mycobacteriales bacterium]|nr:TIGR03619 family F420-dependent LLM class oxidoreductase [Mycobacteriales bacterium]